MLLVRLLLALFLLSSSLFSSEGEVGDLSAVRAAYESGRAAFESHDPSSAESVEATRTALVEVFRAGSLDQVHALLKDGTIDADMSRRLADVRNRMIEEVRGELAKKHKEVHVTNFSPASNLLNDIDQTFRPSERLAELGVEQNGTALKEDFRALWQERFGILPDTMDVVSHTSEAGIPDWRQSREVHAFAAELRKGSRLLSDNPEAYYLEGAFRMQVERRSFASELELYSIYSYAPRTDDEVAKVGAKVERRDGTIGRLAYKDVAPEVRRSYAAGSTVGNWWFMNAHGGGTRYAAKYGLRSFSEGPGFLVTWADAGAGEVPQPVEFEKLASYAERQSYCDDVYNTHFRGSELSRAELWDTLETARVIRNAGDRFTPELAFEKRALERVAGDRDAYERNKAELLAQADLEFRESMTQVMIRNMEVALPERLADWLDPRVDPRVIGLSEEDIRDKTSRYDEEMAKARKRLRTAALFESMHALRVLEPAVRERVLESAIENLKRRSGTDEKGRYPFERSLRAVAKLAGGEARPRLLQLDDERVPRRRFSVKGDLVVVIDEAPDPRSLSDVPLAEQVEALHAELDAALESDGLFGGRGALGDLGRRWESALAEAEDNLRGRVELLDPRNYRYAMQSLRRGLWNQLGWSAEGDWRAMKSLGPEVDPVASMRFDRRQLYDNVVNLGNAQAVLNLVDAYRKAGTSPDQKYEAVSGTLLLELAGRLPYVGEAMQVSDILAGKQNPYFGTGLLVAGFVYPGVGQVVAVYGVASGTWALVYDLSIEAWIAGSYQGRIPNADGSAPGRPRSEVWKESPGILEPIRDWMLEQRGELLRERSSAEPMAVRAIDSMLARFPENPTIDHVRDAVHSYYSRELLATLERNGRPPSDWDAIQLDTFGDPIRSNEPADLVITADLPPLLRAYLLPLVRAYFEGAGSFADLPGHRVAHEHPLHRETYFHAGSASQQSRAVEDLTTVLTAAYMRSLLARARGLDTGLVIDERWDARALTGAEAYLFGLPAANFAGRERAHPGAGPAPALPALLDLFGATREEQSARFFPELDAELDKKLERYAAKHGTPAREEFDAFKLGKHHAVLRPVAAENQAVAHPLLLAFFTKKVTEYWNGLLAPPARDAGDPMSEFELPPMDTGSVGPSATTAGTVDVWRADHMEAELAEADRQRIVSGLVQQLIGDYKRGLLQAIAQHRSTVQQQALDAQLPAVSALGKMSDAVWGDRDQASDRAAARELAQHEWLPNLYPDEAFTERLESELRRIPDAVEVEITGMPTGGMTVGDELELLCDVKAADVHWERPYRVEWSLEGLGAGTAREKEGASPSDRQHELAFEVGSEEEGIDRREVRVIARVTDATGREMGSSTATFAIDETSEPEDEDDPAASEEPTPPSASSGEEEEREIERVAYVIRVEGGGWIPHYAGGSYITKGYNDEVMWVKNGDDPQAAIDAYRDRLDRDWCEVQMPAIPGQNRRPSYWTSGPKVWGIEGPLFDRSAIYGLDLESTWSFSDQDGPSMGEIRKMRGCN